MRKHLKIVSSLPVKPDYAHKIFADKRLNYSFLIVSLSMDTSVV